MKNARRILFVCLISSFLLLTTALHVSAATAGGWKVNKTTYQTCLTSEQKKMFKTAMKDLTGVSYKPIAVLGTQVVAGTNYAYLCSGTTVTAKPATNFYLITLYKDLQNTVTVSNIRKLNLASIKTTTSTTSDGQLAGGWTFNTKVKAGKLPSSVAKLWKKATANYVGKSLTPITLLGSQVVNGTNYMVLCKGKTVTAKPETTLDLVILHVSLDGKASILRVEQVKEI